MDYVTKELHLPHITLTNRLVLPPMASGKASAEGFVTPNLLAHYAEKSHGGYLSLVIIEHSFVSKEGRASAGQLSIANDQTIDGLKQLTATVHQAGAKVAAQLNHAGGAAQKAITGLPTVAPSLVSLGKRPPADCALTQDDIARIVQSFADAAKRAVCAGFDAVEIHSAHGYLLNQFYSPLTNLRTDEYGGGILNRIRLHLEIIDAVRAVVGSKYPLLLRLGACDYKEGGSALPDALAAAKAFEQAGIDILDISGGLSGYIIPGRENIQGYFAAETQAIKQEISLPVILTGGVTKLSAAETLIASGKADLIGIGRAMLHDSNWAETAFAALS